MIDYIVRCPFCGKDNPVFFDKTMICLECLHEWVEEPPEDSEYDKLVKLEKPFFKLKHGKLFDCKAENKEGVIEDISIMPLAFEKGKNRQFVLFNARNIFNKDPSFIHDIIKMDFDCIWNDEVRNSYPLHADVLTLPCATQSDGKLLCYYYDNNKLLSDDEAKLFDFIENNEL